VQARIDRLDPADKEAAQAASVLGPQFATGALIHSSTRRITCLKTW
jgi:hypothetical protein